MNIFNNNSIIQTLYSIKYIQHTQKLMVHSGYSVCSAQHVPNPKRENQITDTCEGNGVGILFWSFVPLMSRTKCMCMLVGVFKSHIGNKWCRWWGLLAPFPDWQILFSCLSLILQLEMRKTNQHYFWSSAFAQTGCACLYWAEGWSKSNHKYLLFTPCSI